MEYRPLGTTGTDVSLIGLGTMTWGEQNSEAQAREQLDYAVDHGVNFIDTAEMYPVPPRAETAGLTDRYIGNWLRGRSDRDRLILATKIAGPGLDHCREGRSRHTPAQLRESVEGSLERLQTDTIDLFQLHWPARSANYFGKLGFEPKDNDILTPLEETLEGLDKLVREGKIRWIGVSNETPWGVMKFLQLAEERGWPRIQSVQNPYNLLNRTYEVGLAEVSYREQCGLLAYSPLGFGTLSGKYLDDNWPDGARLTLFSRFQRYLSSAGRQATAEYVAIARDHGLDPAQLALAWVNSRPFVTSNIIGATTMEQLRSNIASVDVGLNDAVHRAIEDVHARIPNPCP